MEAVFKSDKQLLGELGDKFRTARINSGLSQEALAEVSGVSRSSITRFEAGENISLLNLIALLRHVDQLEELNSLLDQSVLDPRIAYEREQNKRRRAKRS